MEFHEKMKTIQFHILEFLDNDEEIDSNFDNLSTLLSFQPNQLDIQELKSILHLISKISKNHHRGQFFVAKIKKIIIHLKEAIKQTFSTISKKVQKSKHFFYPEFLILNENEEENPINLPEDYEKNG